MHKPYTFAIRTSQRYAKNCKRVCLANAQSELNNKHRKNKLNKKALLTTPYIINCLVINYLRKFSQTFNVVFIC
jgi:hypothetical protein